MSPPRAPNPPAVLNEIWAKSADKGAGGQPETLVQHTWAVIAQFAQRARLRPNLPESCGLPSLWRVLYLAALFHDLGKAAQGFQARLRGGAKWPHRHEVLSLAFVPWLDADVTDDDRRWLIAAIASHHRDLSVINGAYGHAVDPDAVALRELVSQIDDAIVGALWDWLAGCIVPWAQTCGLPKSAVDVTLIPRAEALNQFRTNGAHAIRKGLRIWTQLYEQTLSSAPVGAPERVQSVLLRGHLIAADHMASAHVGDLLAPDFPDPIRLAARLQLSMLFAHQEQARDALGSLALMAPTGSGKTEAALLWAMAQRENNAPPPRLFYHLPFQASMNAMLKRLSEADGERTALFPGQVSLEHSKSVLALYRTFRAENAGVDLVAAKRARHAMNLARLHYYPVRVLTPYQLLKAPYRLHGYETLLTDCANSVHIFDEIHAFEPERLGRILATIRYLRERFGARCLLMSATLPGVLRERLTRATGSDRVIRASASLYEQFRRHRLCLRVGELLAPAVLDEIAALARTGKSVLVCCNTVIRAQDAWRALQDKVRSEVDVVLLHGRYNAEDRLCKEDLVRAATGSRSQHRKPIILVATQVVEVSLDIDLDTIYTDPAPLEALLQRFGRINSRRLNTDGALVHVFREPDDGQRVYDERLVRAALSVLERHDGQWIDEARVSDWLDEIYAQPEIASDWTSRCDDATHAFERNVLAGLCAFESDDALEHLFYQAFDGVEVLPVQLQARFDALRDEDPLRASELLVMLRWGQYHMLKRKGWAREPDGDTHYPHVVLCAYDRDNGLDIKTSAQGALLAEAIDDSI